VLDFVTRIWKIGFNMHIKLFVGLALLAIPTVTTAKEVRSAQQPTECHQHHSYQPIGTFRLSSRGTRYRVDHPHALPGYPIGARRYYGDPSYYGHRHGQLSYSGSQQYRIYYPAVDHTQSSKNRIRRGR